MFFLQRNRNSWLLTNLTRRINDTMKNIQIIDGATNATFSVFQVNDDDFLLIFPNGQDMELIEDLIKRLGQRKVENILQSVWNQPVLKRDVQGIHGTLYYDNERRIIPATKREVDWNDSAINQAQRELFSHQRRQDGSISVE